MYCQILNMSYYLKFLDIIRGFSLSFEISASNLKSPQTIVFLFPIDSITFLDLSFDVYIESNSLTRINF